MGEVVSGQKTQIPRRLHSVSKVWDATSSMPVDLKQCWRFGLLFVCSVVGRHCSWVIICRWICGQVMSRVERLLAGCDLSKIPRIMPLCHGSPIEFFNWRRVSTGLVTKLLKVEHIVLKRTWSHYCLCSRSWSSDLRLNTRLGLHALHRTSRS